MPPCDEIKGVAVVRFVVRGYTSARRFKILVRDVRVAGRDIGHVTTACSVFDVERGKIDKLPIGPERARRGRLWGQSCPNRDRTMLILEEIGEN